MSATGPSSPSDELAPGTSEAAIWHEVECGGYRADLALWLWLASRAIPEPGAEPILDLGAGTGRVTLALARAGHRVTAVEADRDLAAALTARARGLPVTVIVADARELRLDAPHALAIAAMQTVQLLGGQPGRRAFLRAAKRSLLPGATLACAMIEELEPFDAADGDVPPDPETRTVAGVRYESRAVRVAREQRRTVIERERTALAPGAPDMVRTHLDELDILTADQLEREGARAGLRVLRREAVPATAEHIGSAVVMFGA